MAASTEPGGKLSAMESEAPDKKAKLGTISGVYVPSVLNIISILMFLRFGSIIGEIGLCGMLGILLIAYFIGLMTILSLSAIASNGEVKGGGAYYLISRSLGPEFGGSIGILFYISQVLNTALNIVGLIDCLKLNFDSSLLQGYWRGYFVETCALLLCTAFCLAGSAIFTRAGNGLLFILVLSTLSIPLSAIVSKPFDDKTTGAHFTGISYETLVSNLYPHTERPHYKGLKTFRKFFGVLFPATSSIFAGASMSAELKNPSKSISQGTLWAMLSTFSLYALASLSLAATVTHGSLLRQPHIISETSIWPPLILAGECATALFSALMGVNGSASILRTVAKDRILPGLSMFSRVHWGRPLVAIFATYLIAQLSLFADLNEIATFISMGYLMTFFVMNLACFLLKIGSAPNFRPAFKFFSWKSAFAGSILSAGAMFFIQEAYATSAICVLVLLFLVIHYLSPPKHWGDVSQNLIYHQVRKYLLRLKPEHIKFWRPQVILLINDPRQQTKLIQFCNSLKKGSLYILGHAIVTDDFNTGIQEAKLQHAAWTKYISEFSKIKAFVQLTMSPTIEWGIRNLIISAGLGGMRPNIAILGFYNMDELRRNQPLAKIPEMPILTRKLKAPIQFNERMAARPRRGGTPSGLLDGSLPTDNIRIETMMPVTSYMTIIEDLALRHRTNVALGKGFQSLEAPGDNSDSSKRYIDLWPIQMSAEITAQGGNILTTNFDTYTLILQLGYILHSVRGWKTAYELRVMAFVEYESEVIEEEARLRALLEKLRIPAEIYVFWLASGRLETYETIVNGNAGSEESVQTISELLQDDEWWQSLQRWRDEGPQNHLTQDLNTLEIILEVTRRRSSSNIDPRERMNLLSRKLSFQNQLTRPRKTTVSRISKLGGNFNIRTHDFSSELARGREVLDDSSSDDYGDDEDSSSSDVEFNDAASVVSDGDAIIMSPRKSRTLVNTRRRSYSDLFSPPEPPRRTAATKRSDQPVFGRQSVSGYGTMSFAEASNQTFPSSSENTRLDELSPLVTSTNGFTKAEPAKAGTNETKRNHSRQSSATNFPRLIPEDKVSDGSPSSGLATETPNEKAPKPERPPISRTSSMGRFSSRPVPEMKVEEEHEGPRLMFADSKTRPPSLHNHSRNNSILYHEAPPSSSEALLYTPELLDSHYSNLHKKTNTGHDRPHSEHSMRSLPLSFNDLPNRAQHLILNELMRQHSGHETAVIMTTLPIPEEGTCRSEEESLRYLSDIELLCHELPPVLLVLSNNMTVTVSL